MVMHQNLRSLKPGFHLDLLGQSAYTRIQKQIDSSNMGYIQFNGNGLNYGIEIGNATDGEKYYFCKKCCSNTLS